jgi:hypothetical protein
MRVEKTTPAPILVRFDEIPQSSQPVTHSYPPAPRTDSLQIESEPVARNKSRSTTLVALARHWVKIIANL